MKMILDNKARAFLCSCKPVFWLLVRGASQTPEPFLTRANCLIHLRNFLLYLDSSEDKAMLMRKAMKEPLFLEFVDVCLDTLDPQRGKELTDEELVKAIQEQVEEADD